jgi:hypothetical protein
MSDIPGVETDLAPLTHDDLARRIQSLDLGVAAAAPASNAPRWIDPAELVRRVAPYLSQN